MKWQGRRIIEKGENVYDLVATIGKEFFDDPVYKQLSTFVQHRVSNTMRHSIGVASSAAKAAQRKKIAVDVRSLIRGALLHDFYLYEYTKCYKKGHFHRHGIWAAENAEKHFGINELEKNIIECHMWPIRFWAPPRSREAFLVCWHDKVVCFKEFFGFKHLA